MPDAQIYNAAGAYGLTATPPVTFVEMVNNSAGALAPGDLVCFGSDVTGVLATTTTTVNDKTAIGVVAAKNPSDSLTVQSGVTYPVNAPMPVIVRGPARINIGPANTVAVGDLLASSAVAKVAATNAGTPAANAVTGSIIAIALEASGSKDAATNTIRAYINK